MLKRSDISQKDELRFWSKVDVKGNIHECWEWEAYKNKQGYGCFGFKNKSFLSTRFSYILYYGDIPEHDSYHGMCVCHHCDNPSCVNPHHLFLGTHQDNVKDRDNKNRRKPPKGISNGRSKLTEQQVLEIRSKYIPRVYTHKMLADEYNIFESTIDKIVNNKIWTHI